MKKASAGRLSSNEKGAAAVEFAMVLGVFFMVLFGIIEYGWVMTRQMLLSHAVSEGARAAVAMPAGASDQELKDKVRETAKNLISPVGTLADADIYVEIRKSDEDTEPPLPKRVFVKVASWQYTPLVGYLPGSAVPDSLKSSASFVLP